MPAIPSPVMRDVLPLLSAWMLLFEVHGSPAAAEMMPVSDSFLFNMLQVLVI